MSLPNLSRRERQIMDYIYRVGQATATEVEQGLPDPPSNSAVRALLRILEQKGHLRHVEQGKRYVYVPIQPRRNAALMAMRQVVQTFFGGSVENAVATLLTDEETALSEEEMDRLAAMIEDARKGGR